MKNNKPLITVVTVAYNCICKIERTMCSVLSQTYPYIEYIIIDGGSKDGTLDIINKYRDNVACFISEPDKGIFDAMNKALKNAHGDWINFMNAGDVFIDDNVLYDVFTDAHSDYSVIWGCVDGRCEDGHVIKRKLPVPFYEQIGFVKSMGFNHQGVFVNLKKFPKVRFNTFYKIAADYDMLRHIYDEGGSFLYVNRTIAIIEIEEGLSANNRCKQRQEEALISGVDIASVRFVIWTNYMKYRQTLVSIVKTFFKR